ncbi:MAG: cob(I)yrinic acid a,c-diamide adenosyltransferase, partial [Rhodothermales bacterium]|nr:cob(I)yrinic acid a,c-diamide adenosyltransferase [Rhodothermales bacterium]
RIEAYGTIDETNAAIGLARSLLDGQAGADRADALLQQVQHDLFVLGGDLAAPGEQKYPVPRIDDGHVDRLEAAIDELEEDLPPLKHFVLPSGTPTGATLHLARTVCRRAERLTVELAHLQPISQAAAQYLNRLSDFLFVLARWVNHQAGEPETPWVPVDRAERKREREAARHRAGVEDDD